MKQQKLNFSLLCVKSETTNNFVNEILRIHARDKVHCNPDSLMSDYSTDKGLLKNPIIVEEELKL